MFAGITLRRFIFAVTLLGLSGLPLTVAHADQLEIGSPAIDKEEPAPLSGVANYTSVAELATAICQDAVVRFRGFYHPSAVNVTPFITIDEPTNRPSLLGIVLADQMLAVINNETSTRFDPSNPATDNQELTGALQELDGYLRVHISGRNDQGDQRSYVVAVEMSEPLYRALHTYIAP